jgi:hypothetical protein
MATSVQPPPTLRPTESRIGGAHVLVIAVAVVTAILVAAVAIVLIRAAVSVVT